MANAEASHLLLKKELKKLDAHIKLAPEDITLALNRAAILKKLGRDDDAKNAYFEILKKAPNHFDALNEMGELLTNMRFRKAACTIYARLVKHYPDNAMGHINYANVLAKSEKADEAIEHYRIALKLNPHFSEAHQGLAYLLTEAGDEENAILHRQKGFENRPLMVFPYSGKGNPITILLLASVIGKAVPIQHHLSNKVFLTSILFVEFYDESLPLPPHQLVFNIIGDADIGTPALKLAEKILKLTSAPIINFPSKVIPTGREANAKNLANISGVITPKIIKLPRQELESGQIALTLSKRGLSYPFLLRAPGFHTGKFFSKIDDEKQLVTELQQIPGPELLLLQYIETKSADGKFRKYRAMMIDGKIYPLHAAVSANWKVHYFSAEMENNVGHRAEDEAFLNNVAGTIGAKALQGLEQICKKLGLDYAGIDFSLNENSELVLFEANATMFVDLPPMDEIWAYRRAPCQQILDAIRTMLISRA